MNTLVDTPKCFLSELLPYDTSTKINGGLKTSLKEYSLLLKAMEQALIAIKSGDFKQFDANVGENACQIRAVKIAVTAQKYFESVKSIEAQITKSKLKIEMLSKSLESLMLKGISFQNLLKQEEIDINLTLDELFLIESFLLSVVKTIQPAKSSSPLCINDKADHKKLKQFASDVSAVFMENLVSKARRLLSAASVAFVQEQAKLLKDEQLEKMCSTDFIVKYNNYLLCVPMFWTYKTLLSIAQKKGIPLVIHAKFLAKDKEYSTVDEEFVFFQPTVNSKDSFYEESVPEDLKKVAIVFQGAVCANTDLLPSKNQWRKAITAQILNVILAGAADHRQYPNQDDDFRIEKLKDKEFEDYRQMARKEGYALENPSKFFIQHVYPATVESMSKLTQKVKLVGEEIIDKQSTAEWPSIEIGSKETQILSIKN